MIHARNHSTIPISSVTSSDDVTIEQVKTCCESMALSDIFPIFIVAGALWILVYCILMTQKIFMDSQYQEIQPKQHGDEEEDEHHAPPQQHNQGNNHGDHPNVEKEK
ncbi:hypothetical protein GCK72_018821 [Caenorhabditis remanei]|uniref:Transmembrane protein n=1 Tax=Caenorhabditis remanei TaxID=31234 RepID=A0A6A5GAS7_CAERE|nr:hypothetical protein GCK72_018821 [Caenorhabditis remanei]KAF1752267.1 hypothetical protein GCK72_018821 [Caenorhabditis remanei]